VTPVPAVAPASSGTPRDGSAHVPLWEFVAATRLQALVAATSKDPNAKITLLLVSPASGLPVLAVKAPTTAAAERAVDAEAHVLAELRTVPLGVVAETIPRVVDFVEFEQRHAPVMTALPGKPMSTSYARRRHTADAARVAADFAAVGAWLAELQRETARACAALEMDAGVVSRMRERFDGDALLEADLERVVEIHARLRLNQVTRTVVHGDFWFGNILLSGDRISGVVDWEAATTCGEPVRDLVRFANMYALYLDRRARPGRRVAGHRGLRAGDWGAGLEYAMVGTGWFPTLYRRFLEDGLARLGAARTSWTDAALAGIAEVAALTDHDDFARLHLKLFRRLASDEVAG
jgi:aminoglycoside phosphotransferase